MKKRVYRCYACLNDDGVFGRNFEVTLADGVPLVVLPDKSRGPAVVCPECGMTNTHPALGANVVPVQVIHFEPPLTKAMFGRAGCGSIACDPATKVVSVKAADLRYTGEPMVVNCPACMATAAFREHSGGGLHPSFDIPLAAGEGGTPEVPELHRYEKPADPTKPPADPLTEIKAHA